jgi:hypothetical protein
MPRRSYAKDQEAKRQKRQRAREKELVDPIEAFRKALHDQFVRPFPALPPTTEGHVHMVRAPHIRPDGTVDWEHYQ